MSYPGPAGAAGANTSLTNDTIHHVVSADHVYLLCSGKIVLEP